jgi:Flp pilus assembly protein TadD
LRRESDAIYYYLSYLAERPDDVRALLSLAAALQLTGQDSAAVAVFERATRLAPDDADVHGQFGRALYELGREEEAVEHLQTAATLGSMDTEVYRALALAFEGQEQFDKARVQYERAIEVEPRNVSARLGLAAVLSGAPPVAEEDARRSVEQATRAIEILSEEGRRAELANAFWELGWAHYALGDWAESISASRQALTQNGSLTPVRFNLGLALLRSGESEQALAEYRRAAEKADDVWELRHHGIDDLEATRNVEADLPGREEILTLLTDRYEELRRERRRASV